MYYGPFIPKKLRCVFVLHLLILVNFNTTHCNLLSILTLLLAPIMAAFLGLPLGYHCFCVVSNLEGTLPRPSTPSPFFKMTFAFLKYIVSTNSVPHFQMVCFCNE